jgi:hypothetical protein
LISYTKEPLVTQTPCEGKIPHRQGLRLSTLTSIMYYAIG